MFTCIKMRKRFYEYLRDNLSITEKAKIESHLNKCPFCLKEFTKTKNLLGLLSQNETPKPTEDFWRHFDVELKEKIASATKKEAPRYILRPIRSFSPTLSLRPAYSFALVLVFMILGISIINRFYAKPLMVAKSELAADNPTQSIVLVQSEEEVTTDSADDLLEELYLLDELSQSEDTQTSGVPDATEKEEIDSSDLPFLYELDPQLAEELEVG